MDDAAPHGAGPPQHVAGDLAQVTPADLHVTLTRSIWLGAPPDWYGPPVQVWNIEVLAAVPSQDEDALPVVVGHGSAETYSLDSEILGAADDYSADAVCCISAVLDPDGFSRRELELEAMGSRIAHIDRLWLEPSVRGRGLGLAVLRECADWRRACSEIYPRPDQGMRSRRTSKLSPFRTK